MSRRGKQEEGADAAASAYEGGKPEAMASKIYTGLAAVAAGTVMRKVIERVWERAVGKAPPDEPESPTVHWAEAVGWAVVSGTSVAVARLLATRKATATWQRVSAESPTRPGGSVR